MPSASPAPKLSIIIPCYNEEKRLPSTFEEILRYMEGFPYTWELLICDDGSKDATVAYGKEMRAQHGDHIRVIEAPGNMGKGAATRRGMLAAYGKYRLFTDADNSTPIEEVEKLLLALKKRRAHVAIGSRALKQSQLEVRQPWHREMMGRTFNAVVQNIATPGIRDTQCGFKLFTAEATEQLFGHQQLNGFSFDVEILYLARRFRYPTVEVPIRWINNEESKVSPVKDSLRVFRDVLTIRWIHRKTTPFPKS
jgi:dolichyl-phosphate beta-glucosyltransferase